MRCIFIFLQCRSPKKTKATLDSEEEKDAEPKKKLKKTEGAGKGRKRKLVGGGEEGDGGDGTKKRRKPTTPLNRSGGQGVPLPNRRVRRPAKLIEEEGGVSRAEAMAIFNELAIKDKEGNVATIYLPIECLK